MVKYNKTHRILLKILRIFSVISIKYYIGSHVISIMYRGHYSSEPPWWIRAILWHAFLIQDSIIYNNNMVCHAININTCKDEFHNLVEEQLGGIVHPSNWNYLI